MLRHLLLMDAGSSSTTAHLRCNAPDRHPSRLGVRCRGLPRERPAVGARLLLLHHAWRRGAARTGLRRYLYHSFGLCNLSTRSLSTQSMVPWRERSRALSCRCPQGHRRSRDEHCYNFEYLSTIRKLQSGQVRVLRAAFSTCIYSFKELVYWTFH
jgi:hypothetical protein